MTLSFRLFVYLALGVFLASAPFSFANSENEDALSFENTGLESEETIQKAIVEVEGSTERLKLEVQKKALVIHRYNEGSRGATFLWEDENSVQKSRDSLLKLSHAEMKSLLRQLEILSLRKEVLKGDLELLRLRNEEILAENRKAADQAKALKDRERLKKNSFVCESNVVEPLQEKVKVVEPFGLHRDKETGLQWKNSGLWLTDMNEQVRACSSGTVLFSGKIAGRGRVVMVDHGAGSMTLYANLNDDASVKLTRGDRVQAGSVVGTVGEKLFFEVRRAGVALNPEKALSPKFKNLFQF